MAIFTIMIKCNICVVFISLDFCFFFETCNGTGRVVHRNVITRYFDHCSFGWKWRERVCIFLCELRMFYVSHYICIEAMGQQC